MVFLDDLKEMTLYKKPFVLPIDEENIRKGSAIFLVSPNVETSKEMMKYPYMINKMNTFNSYYLEKNANYYINQEGNLIPIDRDDEYIHEVSEEELEEKYTYYNNKKYKKVPKSAKLYHGSRTQNLKELTPKNDSISRVGNATVVYASKDKRFAACYGTAWRDDIAKQGTWDKWNTVVMGISDKVVMDQPCSLYELENDGSFIEISDKEVISLNTIKVKKERKYSSYAEMLKQNGVKTISYDEYIKNIKSPNPEFHYLNEAALSSKERNELSDSDFGIPSLRKYPLTDAKHVKSAIRFFNYVDSEHEAELAKNIKRKAIEFKVPIRCGEGNRLSKYITEEYVQEFMSVASIGNDMTAVVNGTIRQHIAQGDMVYSFDHQKPYTKKTKKKKEESVIESDSAFQSDDLDEGPDDVFFDDMIKDIENTCSEEFEPFPTDVLNEKKGSH